MNEIKKAIEYFESQRKFMAEIDFYGQLYKNLAIEALQEKLERANPKPLTVEELKKRNDKPVWIDGAYHAYSHIFYLGEGYIGYELECFIAYFFGNEDGEHLYVKDYGITWSAYDHKPNKD